VISVVSKRGGSKPVPVSTIRVYVGRPSPLGNPFEIGRHGSRAEVIEQYDRWLTEREVEGEVGEELSRLLSIAVSGDLELECWCAPQACHADIIKQWLEAQI